MNLGTRLWIIPVGVLFITREAPVTHSHFPPLVTSHLKTQAAAIEASFMHGGVFPDETLAEATFILEEQVSVAVVM